MRPSSLALAFVAASFIVVPALAAGPHPLDALSANEITRAVALLRAAPEFPAGGQFALLDLKEPPKAEVLAFREGLPLRREVIAAILDRAGNRTLEAVVDLRADSVSSWTPLAGVHAPILFEEYGLVTDIVRADSRWQEAMRRRGIDDMSKVAIDGWAPGAQLGSKRRLMRGLSFLQGDGDNYYARPIEGVVAVVDMGTQQVVDVVDTGVVPVSARARELDLSSARPALEEPKPLTSAMPEGPTFTVDGNAVRWQGWRFRFSFHPREGLVLHEIAREDAGRTRSVLYRAALSEMIVPYGDPDANWSWRSAFDVGEYGFGRLASPLDPGKDVPEHARVLDAVLASSSGEVLEMPRAIAIHESDGGILWKHHDVLTGRNHVRRARQLHVVTAAVIGNYDYVISWIFHQDGTLALDAALSGILLAKGTSQEQAPGTPCPGCASHLVDRNLLAPNHQHFFNVRLDFDVDGTANEVREMDVRPLRGPGGGFAAKESVLASESRARRDVAPSLHRKWKIVNAGVRNSLGHASGYALVPGGSTLPLPLPSSSARRRAAFLDHALWVTRHRDAEMNAAGDWPNQAPRDMGLSRWAADDERIAGEDLVVWYTMGLNHVPRAEEWPVMNVHHVGFEIHPSGFYASNPVVADE